MQRGVSPSVGGHQEDPVKKARASGLKHVLGPGPMGPGTSHWKEAPGWTEWLLGGTSGLLCSGHCYRKPDLYRTTDGLTFVCISVSYIPLASWS